MKNLVLLTLAMVTPALLAFGLKLQDRYSDLEEYALIYQQDSQWFSMDVTAVDAETGEVIATAGLGHPVQFEQDEITEVFSPRISRVYDAERHCTRLSGISDRPLIFTISARGYEPAEFKVVPHRVGSDQPTLTIELAPRFQSIPSSLATISQG
jgi:hypothetical protein